MSTYFSDSYEEARRRFLAKAGEVGAHLHHLPLSTGHGIDIGFLGPKSGDHLFLHTTGLHGVEGFAGSAIQLALLDELCGMELPRSVCLIHVMNPYGMSYLRRVNENNVDLNRNFIDTLADLPENPGYTRLSELLNPEENKSLGGFRARAVWQILRHGLGPLQQAIAQGQYRYPQGLFYGGSEIEAGPARLLKFLEPQLRSAKHVFGLDVHCGLGKKGSEGLYLEGIFPCFLQSASGNTVGSTCAPSGARW